jgi:hypothetical protein
MSFCLAVGSPALITYSLTVTILNRYWVRQHFHTLTARMQKNSRWARYEKRIEAARYLLEEAQQVPLRAPQYKGWLSSLIVKPENEDWWLDLKKRLRRTRRGVTASLVAQVLSAAIAYLFTVISSFSASIDDLGTAMQISAGSLWIWLVRAPYTYPIRVRFRRAHLETDGEIDPNNLWLDCCWYSVHA